MEVKVKKELSDLVLPAIDAAQPTVPIPTEMDRDRVTNESVPKDPFEGMPDIPDLPDLTGEVPAYPGVKGALGQADEQESGALPGLDEYVLGKQKFIPDEGAGALRFPEGDGPAGLALLEPSDPLARQQSYLGLRRGELQNVYRLAGWQSQSLVDNLLASAGFGGSLRTPHWEPVPVEQTVGLLVTATYTLPAGVTPEEIARKLTALLSPRAPGLSAVVTTQAFFHSPHRVFEQARLAAGAPPASVVHPEIFGGQKDMDLLAIAKQHSRSVNAAVGESGAPRSKPQAAGWKVVGSEAAPLCPSCQEPMIKRPARGGWIFVCPNAKPAGDTELTRDEGEEAPPPDFAGDEPLLSV